MTGEQIKNLHRARPFKPFDIHVADGDVLKVRRPEFMWLTPGGRTTYVAQGDERVAIVDLLLVTKPVAAESSNGKKRPKRRR